MSNSKHESGRLSRLGRLAVAAGLLLLFLVLTGPTCFFYHIFGLPCPGCGVTRALLAAIQGEFSRAWQLHPLFALPVLLLLATWFLKSRRQRLIFWTTAGLAFILVYCIRLYLLFPGSEPFVFNQDALLPRIWRARPGG